MNENNTSIKFVHFINSLIERPGMYQINKVEDFGLLIIGYKYGVLSCSDEYNSIDLLMEKFTEFVNKEFETTENVDWVRLIRYHGNGDNNSLKLFAIKFNRFIEGYNS